MTTPAHFVFLLTENFSHLAFSCALEPLRIANLVAGQEIYRWSLASENGHTATCSNRSVTLVDRGLDPLDRNERLFLISGIDVQDHATPSLLAYLRRQRAIGRRMGAICSGAWILARAGFLDGLEAAIHWEFHDAFAEAFPNVRLVRNVFVAHEPFVTASGGTAAADLMLRIIAAEHGQALSTAVADQMVYNAVREGTAAQRVSIQSRHGMRNSHLSRAIQIMEANIEAPVSPCEIARVIGISTRQLERLFVRFLNTSPKRYLREMRLHRARNLIVQSEQSVAEIAMACGFNSTSHFAKVFRHHFGTSPLHHRSTLG
jgi:transcriptional regulator GlxA family with amidase domain